eukprot:COSAG05_NODE_7420_length_813_cov_0.843137_1_plen_68_part_10
MMDNHVAQNTTEQNANNKAAKAIDPTCGIQTRLGFRLRLRRGRRCRLARLLLFLVVVALMPALVPGDH